MVESGLGIIEVIYMHMAWGHRTCLDSLADKGEKYQTGGNNLFANIDGYRNMEFFYAFYAY